MGALYLYIKWEIIQFQILHESSLNNSLLCDERFPFVIVQKPVPNLFLWIAQGIFNVQFGIPEFIEFYGFRLWKKEQRRIISLCMQNRHHKICYKEQNLTDGWQRPSWYRRYVICQSRFQIEMLLILIVPHSIQNGKLKY